MVRGWEEKARGLGDLQGGVPEPTEPPRPPSADETLARRGVRMCPRHKTG